MHFDFRWSLSLVEGVMKMLKKFVFRASFEFEASNANAAIMKISKHLRGLAKNDSSLLINGDGEITVEQVYKRKQKKEEDEE